MTLCFSALGIFMLVVLWVDILIEEENKENINLRGWLEKRLSWFYIDKKVTFEILLSQDVKKTQNSFKKFLLGEHGGTYIFAVCYLVEFAKLDK